MEELKPQGKTIEAEVRSTRKEYEDGSYDETKVEKVEGGYIKIVCRHYKDNEGEWQWDEQKSVSINDPLEEGSLVERLEKIMKGGI